MQNKKKKSKQLRVENDLFHILSLVKLDDEKWSATARKYLWHYVRAVHGDVLIEIEKAYQLAEKEAEDIEKAYQLAEKEIIKND